MCHWNGCISCSGGAWTWFSSTERSINLSVLLNNIEEISGSMLCLWIVRIQIINSRIFFTWNLINYSEFQFHFPYYEQFVLWLKSQFPFFYFQLNLVNEVKKSTQSDNFALKWNHTKPKKWSNFPLMSRIKAITQTTTYSWGFLKRKKKIQRRIKCN